MTTTDEALACAAAGGDRHAFATLLERHYSRLFGLAFRLTGSREEAEDLTQDVCAALPAKLLRYEERARFTTWLYRVVVNAAHDRRRRRAAYSRAASGWGDWEVLRRAGMAEDAERQDWLVRAMSSLPENLRDTLALTLEDGLTQAEAGEVLGISEGTVAWRMAEVKRLLKEIDEKEREA
ncbi:MAG: RNA polymerase sigma factor [Pseudomonadota bacterium]